MVIKTPNINKVLQAYNNQDYIIRKKALFLLYFIIASLIVTVIMLFATSYLQVAGYEQHSMQTIILLSGLVITYIFCLHSLIKGKFYLSANILIIASLVDIWLIIFFDKSSPVSIINTIVFIFSALTMLPLVINSQKRILFYGFINLFAFLFFMALIYNNLDTYNISLYDFRDTFIDISLALVFSIIIHSYVFSINNIALENAKEEIEHRKKITIELQYHKDNLENLVKEKTDELETTNEELKATNEELNDRNEELNNTLKHLKDAQIQLIQTEKMASLGTLTAGIAHEINNPLNYIMGSYVGLDEYFKETLVKDTKIPILLNGIKVGIERASEIVKGLNQFSRNNETFIEDCNIHSIINNCLVMLNNQLKDRIEVNKNFCNNELKISGNVGKLHQVFINILCNSIQAIDQNGFISITTIKQEQNSIIEIADSGCGISKENLSKIVEPFFTTKDPGQGTGLGLAIAYNIIRDHKGEIEFDSELNKGTIVKITLPNP